MRWEKYFTIKKVCVSPSSQTQILLNNTEEIYSLKQSHKSNDLRILNQNEYESINQSYQIAKHLSMVVTKEKRYQVVLLPYISLRKLLCFVLVPFLELARMHLVVSHVLFLSASTTNLCSDSHWQVIMLHCRAADTWDITHTAKH